MPVPKDLLDIMACSLCKGDLRLEGEKLFCTRAECGLVYSVKDDIPIMLIEEAERPCPKCRATRDWKDDELRCPKCSATFLYPRK
jgi:uncharacterized protein YbaR (Trm112 family)